MKKTVLITGASRGIGKATALAFALKGYHIAICSHNSQEDLIQAKKEIEALGSECESFIADISDFNQVHEMLVKIRQRFHHIDVLVNNAGISHIGLLQDMSQEEWTRILNVNLSSVFNTCNQVIPDMIAAHSGCIINVSSVWGLCGASCEAAYSAAKSGIHGFTKALAKELAPSNIPVNAIACGVIDTQMNHCFTKEEMEELINEIPAGRLGTPQEVASFIVSLSEASPYLTGQVIAFDGGFI